MSAATVSIPVTSAPATVARLFSAHYRRILLAAYRVTGNMADAEDVAQAVFLRLQAQDAPYLANEASYLYRAAINGALDLLRSRQNTQSAPLEAAADARTIYPGDSPEHGVRTRELRRALREAIGELPPRAAEMFTLRYLEELSNKEIARMMGTSQAVVAVTLHQARSRLKKRLNACEWGKR